MEELKINPPELARRLQVSNQTVRYWLSGRNDPRKAQIPAIEKALGPGFRIDLRGEYEAPVSAPAHSPPPAQPDQARSVNMQRRDAELFIMISQLPPGLKQRLWDLIEYMSRGEQAGQQDNSSPGGSRAGGDSAFGGVRHSSARPQLAA